MHFFAKSPPLESGEAGRGRFADMPPKLMGRKAMGTAHAFLHLSSSP
jgi:hypothetical protein